MFVFFNQPEEAEHYWFAFLLFSMKRLRQKNDAEDADKTNGNDFKLYQILRVAKLKYVFMIQLTRVAIWSTDYLLYVIKLFFCCLSFVDFFKELPQYLVKIGPILSNLYGSDWETRLQAKELQANFVHLSLLSKWVPFF